MPGIIAPARQLSPVTGYLKRYKGPISIFLQGTALLVIGIIMFAVTIDNTGHVKKITGVIQDQYGRFDTETGSNVYNGTYLFVQGNDAAFAFNKNDFRPVWDESAGQKGLQTTVYYEDAFTPNKVMALQSYDSAGNLKATYLLPGFTLQTTSYTKPGISPVVGLVVGGVGLLMALISSVIIFRRVRQTG